ncbi:malonate decarboxylase holo-ACP synthase [Vibrio sp. EA2]|uniref:malonate decarboxylase holo-ACP synthase n=1 Tax=Vibrio sp. EA2 TaxID=3079860 RepID=UPI0029494022|nr:malonate decarboxylase holo-ACP synthase [Vibrio sp. EA2]MDV6250687.1 malonate decarboxylase holo-ACP synthase [Vibrio sp. EA2]
MPYNAHDLLWVNDLTLEGNDSPSWYARHNNSLPVVVRRANRHTLIPVGVRGKKRSERLAAWACKSSVIKSVTPKQLVQSKHAQAYWQSSNLTSFQTLTDVNTICERHGVEWGVTGSLGYELATGMQCAHQDSDIDMTLYLTEPLPFQMLESLNHQLDALPCKVDTQIETPLGAVALREWVNSRGKSKVLLKTDTGPLLTNNPWAK